MSDGPRVEFKMPEGWEPARCSVPADNEKSCPFSFRGCYAYKPEACPIVQLVAGGRIFIPKNKSSGKGLLLGVSAITLAEKAIKKIQKMPSGCKFKTTCYGCKYIKAPQMVPPCDNCLGVGGQRRNYKPGGRP